MKIDYMKYGINISSRCVVADTARLVREILLKLLADYSVLDYEYEKILDGEYGVMFVSSNKNEHEYAGLCVHTTMLWYFTQTHILIDCSLILEKSGHNKDSFCKILYKTLAHELQHVIQFVTKDQRSTEEKETDAVNASCKLLDRYDCLSPTGKLIIGDVYDMCIQEIK